MNIQQQLTELVRLGGSDLYISVNSPPAVRVHGSNQAIGTTLLTAAQTEQLAGSIMSDAEQALFRAEKEMNFAIDMPDLGRFRVNVLRQRGTVGMVIREIKAIIPTLEELHLPEVLKDVIMTKRGLVLVVGATGSGKSTTLAAMIDHRNAHSRGHIVTVEDPIEFVHPNKGCIVTQREIGTDTESFDIALKNALRQAPDVILIGEIRDADTMETAITFAETGHLCLGTLHSSNANQALQRIANFFPADRHQEIQLLLSLNLRSIVSQRLIPSCSGGRAAAVEILLDTPWIKALIKSGDVDRVKEGMERGRSEGCMVFDDALLEMYARKSITAAEALANADSANNLRIKMRDADVRQTSDTPAPLPEPSDCQIRIEMPPPPPLEPRRLRSFVVAPAAG